MTARWEYHVEHIQTDLKARLAELGADGWELVSENAAKSDRFVFKRPAGGA